MYHSFNWYFRLVSAASTVKEHGSPELQRTPHWSRSQYQVWQEWKWKSLTFQSRQRRKCFGWHFDCIIRRAPLIVLQPFHHPDHKRWFIPEINAKKRHYSLFSSPSTFFHPVFAIITIEFVILSFFLLLCDPNTRRNNDREEQKGATFETKLLLLTQHKESERRRPNLTEIQHLNRDSAKILIDQFTSFYSILLLALLLLTII